MTLDSPQGLTRGQSAPSSSTSMAWLEFDSVHDRQDPQTRRPQWEGGRTLEDFQCPVEGLGRTWWGHQDDRSPVLKTVNVGWREG